ncbi:hypothetical protein ATCC90586_003108 [Pythium insidiosum]|nr:hypothetical protein ATCC90586_003108 [Pythium insidiosum]
MNKDIKQVLRAMCLEDKVDIRDWTYYVPVLQASLNHTPVPSLGHHAPVEVFCVLPAVSPLDFVLDKRQKELVDIGLHSDQIKSKLETLRESFYADSSFEVTEEVREHIAGQGTVMTVDKLLEHRWHKGKKDFELLVAWKGLEPIENSWETLASLYKDIPVMVKTYTSASKDQALQRRVEQLA